ncbi:ribosomal RNA-processing protein 7-domain-containing protein [Entophlyctis helioformis]|nr:ribosomal RNA-processing protein 7-domain-containing protein [Entophlyctis helioformis]
MARKNKTGQQSRGSDQASAEVVAAVKAVAAGAAAAAAAAKQSDKHTDKHTDRATAGDAGAGAADLQTFAGFKVLPITVPPPTMLARPTPSLHTHINKATLPSFDPESPAVTHHIFMRAHSSRKTSDSLPADRTIFLVNLPADTNILHLRRLFRRCGTIERVVWKGVAGVDPSDAGAAAGATNAAAADAAVVSETLVRQAKGWIHPTGSHAHLVFDDAESVERVLAMKARRRLWSDQIDQGEVVPGVNDGQNMDADADADADADGNADGKTPQTTGHPMGIQKWLLQHTTMFPDTTHLQAQVDLAMTLFEDAEETARRELEAKYNVPDEDGFVTVTRGRGRRNNADGAGASVMAARAEDVKDLKPKANTLVDFYRFQRRENARNQLADLRRKFEEDKLKIASLKTQRRFKPY